MVSPTCTKSAIITFNRRRLNKIAKIRYFAFGLLICLLAACAPSAQAIQTAIAQTQVLSQTPSPTVEINLDEFLLKSGDLSSNFIGEQINHTWVENNAKVTTSKKVFTQMISFKGQRLEVSTYSMVALFDSTESQDEAYKSVVDNERLGEYSNSVVGEKSAFVNKQTGSVSDDVYLVYTRCKALVVVHLWNIEEQAILSYGEKLDERIKPFVCP